MLVDIQIFSGVKLAQALEPARAKRSVSWLANTSTSRERAIERDGLWERLNADDRRALTPLFHGHINPYGQFAIDLAQPSFLDAA